jgi:hypothetical protein
MQVDERCCDHLPAISVLKAIDGANVMLKNHYWRKSMKSKLTLVAAALVLALGTATAVAGDSAEIHEERMVIALITDDFELPETDVSHLAVGDAETVFTESGQTIDILRTADGIEIYVDGELIDAGSDMHGHRVVHKRVEVVCEEEECEELVWMSEDGETGPDLHEIGAHHEKVIIIKERDGSD